MRPKRYARHLLDRKAKRRKPKPCELCKQMVTHTHLKEGERYGSLNPVLPTDMAAPTARRTGLHWTFLAGGK